MRTNIIFLIIVSFVCSQISIAQEMQNSSYDQFKVLPREKVYVSTNTSVLFTGEYLFYKAYILNDKTKQPSDISKIVYIELISQNQEVVFSHKIRLTSSQGQGDFFVPTTLSSGNYKLMAYTLWMRNGSINSFFQEDITVINPYQSNQDVLLPNNEVKKIDIQIAKENIFEEDKRFLLSTDKENYKPKSKVELALKNFRGPSGYGTYNISVRKKEAFLVNEKLTSELFIENHQKITNKTPLFYDEINFAPELDGGLLKGKLFSRDGKTSVIAKKIGVSVPGKYFQLKVVRTDSTGVFHVSFENDYTEPYAILQVLDEEKEAYNIKIETNAKLDYSSLQFKKFYINSDMKDEIVRRSVNNQIENGFFAIKPDTVRLDNLNDPYGGAYIEIINLEEYTRFKTLDETVLEVVPNVWTKKNKKGESVFKVRSFDETYEESEFDALVYIDGVLIPNPNDVLDFDTRTVARINTVREKYRLGGKTYFGMINIETNEGNYFDQIASEGITKILLNQPRPIKKYFTQTYNVTSNKRIPDFRNQLLWKPNIALKGKEMAFSFYTSEVLGDYEVVLEGFSIYGRPVITIETFTVR